MAEVERTAPAGQEFVFRAGDGRELARARSISEFRAVLRDIDAASLRNHLGPGRNDFAAWVEGVFGDLELAARMRAISLEGKPEVVRARLLLLFGRSHRTHAHAPALARGGEAVGAAPRAPLRLAPSVSPARGPSEERTAGATAPPAAPPVPSPAPAPAGRAAPQPAARAGPAAKQHGAGAPAARAPPAIPTAERTLPAPATSGAPKALPPAPPAPEARVQSSVPCPARERGAAEPSARAPAPPAVRAAAARPSEPRQRAQIASLGAAIAARSQGAAFGAQAPAGPRSAPSKGAEGVAWGLGRFQHPSDVLANPLGYASFVDLSVEFLRQGAGEMQPEARVALRNLVDNFPSRAEVTAHAQDFYDAAKAVRRLAKRGAQPPSS